MGNLIRGQVISMESFSIWSKDMSIIESNHHEALSLLPGILHSRWLSYSVQITWCGWVRILLNGVPFTVRAGEFVSREYNIYLWAFSVNIRGTLGANKK